MEPIGVAKPRDEGTPRANRISNSKELLDHSLSEMRWIISVWGVFFVWVIGYCRLFGYARPVDEPGSEPAIQYGMPAWVVWGVLVPWLLAAAVSSWFAIFHMANDPLGNPTTDEQPSD